MDQPPPLQSAPELANRIYWSALFSKIAGRNVVLTREVDRQPYFSVQKGATGVLQTPCLDDDGRIFVAVKLDDPPAGSEPFDGELHWMEAVNLVEFEDDVLVLAKDTE